MLASFSCVLVLLAAPEIAVRAGTPIALDGKVDPAEWSDAVAASAESVHLRLKRNGPWLAVALRGDEPYQGEIVRILVVDGSGAWLTELTLTVGQPAMPPGLWRRSTPDALRAASAGAGLECPRACRIRADFASTESWQVEYLVRLTALGIGRGDRHAFRGGVFVSRELPEPRHLFGLPAGVKNPYATGLYAPLVSDDAWGAGETWMPVTAEESREFDDHGLLYRLYLEHEAFSLRDVVSSLVIGNAIFPRSLNRINTLRNELEAGRARNPGLPAWQYFNGRLLHESNHYAEARAIVESIPPPLRKLDAFANLIAEHYMDTEVWDKALKTCYANPGVRGMLDLVKMAQAGQAAWAEEQKRIEEDAKKVEKNPRVRLVTSKGNIDLELFEDDAPHAVMNFMDMVLRRKFYDGLRFHEVAGGRLARVGDPRTRRGSRDRSDGPPWRLHFDPPPRPPLRGYVAMAPTDEGPSHGSQFVLTVAPLIRDAGKMAVFGRVVAGQDVLDSIEQDDRLERVEVLSKRNHTYEALSSRMER